MLFFFFFLIFIWDIHFYNIKHIIKIIVYNNDNNNININIKKKTFDNHNNSINDHNSNNINNAHNSFFMCDIFKPIEKGTL